MSISSRPTDLGATLQLLRDGRPRTRAELATVTGQARSTIAQRIDQLLSAGLLAPGGGAVSTGGRPPATFAFNPAARLVAAVDLGATHSRIALTDLGATVLVEQSEDIDITDGPEVVLGRVADVVTALVSQTGRVQSDLVGVGVGLPGPVDHESGRPISPPIMPGWDQADVRGFLQQRLGKVPVLVDNDVNIMALGEHAAGLRDVDHLLFVKVATGIGAGLVSDGAIRRGAQGAAGDLGHVAVPGGDDVLCTCGNTGCLEALASGQTVARRLAASGLDVHSSVDVVALVRSGNAEASAAVREAGRSLGAVLATCVNLLNPSVVVIGGSLAGAGDHLLAGIREVVYRRSLPLATQHLRIVTSRTGGRAAVIGAATMVIDQVLSDDSLEQLF
ncbi:ROK family transcriptional regulator [Aquipuribacter nitratireducens]|uniref:ROK family protein n=1 Tax=Aquipuribacter nitratireducens TaxID=650104 RepID=A0ABW0GR60_9MICO